MYNIEISELSKNSNKVGLTLVRTSLRHTFISCYDVAHICFHHYFRRCTQFLRIEKYFIVK